MNVNEKSKRFLCEEWSRAYKTAEKLLDNLAVPEWAHQHLTSSGAYLGDLYKAIENTLRTLVEEIEGKKLAKNDRWHIALLEKSYEHGLIPEEHYKTIREMLGYRHVYVHGYSTELDEKMIRKNAPEAIDATDAFVQHIRKIFDISIPMGIAPHVTACERSEQMPERSL